jgi:ribulose 1,5-bisphosphate synthetase/thiazole synthase
LSAGRRLAVAGEALLALRGLIRMGKGFGGVRVRRFSAHQRVIRPR